jgi:hypothetical protein
MAPLPAGWGEHTEDLMALLNLALTIRDVFRNKLYGLKQSLGADNMQSEAIRRFHDRSESYIHTMLQNLNWDKFGQVQNELTNRLVSLCWEIIDELAEPYGHKPDTFQKIAVTRATLGKEFKKIKEGLQ